MEKLLCKNCAHFYQHYALDKRKIFRIYCGHCALKYPKSKKPDAPACDSFMPGLPDESAFATKEYLSKELLQYLLSLELLPSLEDATELT